MPKFLVAMKSRFLLFWSIIWLLGSNSMATANAAESAKITPLRLAYSAERSTKRFHGSV